MYNARQVFAVTALVCLTAACSSEAPTASNEEVAVRTGVRQDASVVLDSQIVVASGYLLDVTRATGATVDWYERLQLSSSEAAREPVAHFIHARRQQTPKMKDRLVRIPPLPYDNSALESGEWLTAADLLVADSLLTADSALLRSMGLDTLSFDVGVATFGTTLLSNMYGVGGGDPRTCAEARQQYREGMREYRRAVSTYMWTVRQVMTDRDPTVSSDEVRALMAAEARVGAVERKLDALDTWMDNHRC